MARPPGPMSFSVTGPGSLDTATIAGTFALPCFALSGLVIHTTYAHRVSRYVPRLVSFTHLEGTVATSPVPFVRLVTVSLSVVRFPCFRLTFALLYTSADGDWMTGWSPPGPAGISTAASAAPATAPVAGEAAGSESPPAF